MTEDIKNITAEDEGQADPQITPDEMGDEDFNAYIQKIKDGYTTEDDTAENAGEDETADDAGNNIKDNAQAEDDTEKDASDDTGDNPEKNKKTFTQDDVDRIVGERLARVKNKTGEFDEIADEAMKFYGGENSAEALSRMLSDLKKQNATARGISEDDYKTQSETERKAKAYDEIQSANETRENEVKAIQDRWEKESAELREIVPDFDFVAAMRTNEKFKESVLKGKSVAAAYMQATKAEKKPQRKQIKQNAAARTGTSGKTEFNPTTASDEEFRKYINSIKHREE